MKLGNKIANCVINNIDVNKLNTYGEVIKSCTTEQADACAEVLACGMYCGYRTGRKQGFIFGGLTATAALTGFAIYSYKKAHKDDCKEQ